MNDDREHGRAREEADAPREVGWRVVGVVGGLFLLSVGAIS